MSSSEKKTAEVISGECLGCGVCVYSCDAGAISMEDVAVINKSACTGCGDCVTACPADAIRVN